MARINSTPHVIQACLCTLRSIFQGTLCTLRSLLQTTSQVPPTCITKTSFTYLLKSTIEKKASVWSYWSCQSNTKEKKEGKHCLYKYTTTVGRNTSNHITSTTNMHHQDLPGCCRFLNRFVGFTLQTFGVGFGRFQILSWCRYVSGTGFGTNVADIGAIGPCAGNQSNRKKD